MTRNEILQEITTLVDGSDLDDSQFIIIGKAADILNGKDDPTMENIEIWVNPKYYDLILLSGEYAEMPADDVRPARSISFSYIHYEKKYGEIILYRGDGIGSKPRFRKIAGYNVQTSIRETDTARILNFPGKKEQDDTMD